MDVACDLAVELLIWQNIPWKFMAISSEELQKEDRFLNFLRQKLPCSGTLSASETGKTPF